MYDINGMRTQKGDVHYYYDSNNNLIALVNRYRTLFFYYDESGSPTSFSYNGIMHYYVKNLQGDIVKIANEDGEIVADYAYDVSGEITSIKDANGKAITDKTNIAILNPYRYRGYVYDDETGLYYLQSRYYDPVTERFLNSDDTAFLGASGTVLSTNLFTYCENNHVNYNDAKGYFGTPIQWACAAIGGVVGVLFGDSVARNFGLTPKRTPVRYWAVRVAVIVGGAAIGYLIGTAIVKLVSLFVKAHPTVTINLIKKFGVKATTKIMNIFKLNFMKYMKAGTLINFVANWFSSPDKKMPLSFVKLLIEACKGIGIKVVYDAGHKGTGWNIPHLHLGNHKGHLALASEAVEWVKKILGV